MKTQTDNNSSNTTNATSDKPNVVGVLSNGPNITTGTPQENPIKNSILIRARVFYLMFLIMALSAIGMIINHQFGSNSDILKAQSIEYSFRNEIIEAARGDILSSDKHTLATSIVYYDLRIDMMARGLTDDIFNSNVQELSRRLAFFFKDKSYQEYLVDLRTARSDKKRYYRLASRKVDYLELQQIKQFPILSLPPNKGGFIPREMGRRVNPYGELASRTIGFVNTVGVKVGLEGSFDNVLKGTNGLTVKQKISGNFWIPVVNENNIEPVNGNDVITSLNIEIQNSVQNSLRQRIDEMEADWGCVIVMDVNTGQIKAISNITRLKSGQLVEDYNYAIGMSLEPGSTFKLASLITLLDDAKASPEERFDTEDGDAQLGYVKVIDSKIGGYGVISLREIIEKSSNIGIAKAVNKYYGSRPARFVEHLSTFGLDQPLGIEISGESRPFIKHPNSRNGWDGTSLTMMSYGYALRVSPIQTLALYNAVANGGKLVRPQLVTAIESQGKVIKTFPTTVLNSAICSQNTLQQVQSILEGVTTNGTARMLKDDRYSIAAKTGTAQVAIGRHGYKTASGSRHYMGSVAGYFPTDKPKYSMIVVVKTFWDAGSDKEYYGGRLAGPLFKEIADNIFNTDLSMVKQGRISESTKNKELTYCLDSTIKLNNIARSLKTSIPVKRLEITTDSLGVPDVVGVSPILAQQILWSAGYDVITRGRGRIYDQSLLIDSVGKKTIVLKLR